MRIDARGMRCPWPALRLAKALRTHAGEVTVLADDPIAPGELRAVAGQAGRTVTAIDSRQFRVSAARGINDLFTPDS